MLDFERGGGVSKVAEDQIRVRFDLAEHYRALQALIDWTPRATMTLTVKRLRRQRDQRRACASKAAGPILGLGKRNRSADGAE